MRPRHEVEVVEDRERAEVLLHPLRIRVLAAARRAGSAAGLARRLEESPQKVAYHVRRLREHGFLSKVEERRAGNVVESVYQATAERYVIGSGVLGELAPEPGGGEARTVGGWLALQRRAEAELRRVLERECGETHALGALVLDAEFRFETAEQRSVFARAIRELVGAIVGKYTTPRGGGIRQGGSTPGEGEGGGPPAGRPYRLVLGCYPLPEEPHPFEGSFEEGGSEEEGSEEEGSEEGGFEEGGFEEGGSEG